MRLKLLLAATAALLIPLGQGANAQQGRRDQAGQFDYYVMALSWSPTWCATDGRGNREQCDRDLAFVLHGLWPQHERGWPSDCQTNQQDPGRSETRAMADIMGTAGLAWYQWKKHGRCAGLSSRDYFATARRAFNSIKVPEPFLRLDRDVRLPASVVEEAFIEANPRLTPDMIGVSCDEGRIDEVRICLSKDLEPRSCSETLARDCRARDALMEKVR